MCGGIDWVLDTKPSVELLSLELLPCILPDCQWSERGIVTLCVDGRFRDMNGRCGAVFRCRSAPPGHR
jgi:hypothetical protein